MTNASKPANSAEAASRTSADVPNTEAEIEVLVNGESRTVAAGTTLADLVGSATTAETGIAVALNDEVVPRRDWPMHVLTGRDRVEILSAVQGG